jgi:hypothetical protein
MEKLNPRTTRGQLKKGTSGNPSGRPAGSRNLATLLAEQLLEHEAEPLIRQVVNLAKKGNIHALRLCIEGLIPVRWVAAPTRATISTPLPDSARCDFLLFSIFVILVRTFFVYMYVGPKSGPVFPSRFCREGAEGFLFSIRRPDGGWSRRWQASGYRLPVMNSDTSAAEVLHLRLCHGTGPLPCRPAGRIT